jgi:hypothetical protein
MVVPTTESSDETLAARAAAGDDHAFEEIVERYQGRISGNVSAGVPPFVDIPR